MVTHSTTMLEEQQQHLLEAPRPQRRRILAKEDPMSHRIIEKRRRDRMNNCLADLSRLIPADYLKKGRGRIEKTEIIEMAIKHIKYLQQQAHACRHTAEPCELVSDNQNPGPAAVEHYRLGYQDCLAEALHFMVEVEGYFAGDPVCIQLINHLQKHCDKILNGDRLNSPRTNIGESSSSCGSSGGFSNNQHTTGSSSGFRSGSSPGSGSGSDGGNKDVNCGDPQILTSGAEAVGDDQEEVTGGSQLRDMLQEFPVAPPPTLQLPADHGSTPSLYKFKNNIKQRFTAEHHMAPSSSVSGVVKRRRFEVVAGEDAGCLNFLPQSRRRDSETCSVPSSPPSPKYIPPRSPSPEVLSRVPPCPTLKASPGPGIPIFALHSKGSFYVPLTLDADLLAPYLGPGLDTGNPNVILHPVTISVNFQQTGHVRLQPINPPWKNELSFPKWSLCAQDRA